MAAVTSLQKNLLEWYRRHKRSLPWRDRPDPYRVWISELMLQQTQVGAVLPYFEKFIGRFPDVEALAAAELEEVLAAWSGLGYYRRARALHQAARRIVEEHRGRLPDRMDEWLALPGVGRYTAGAILSIAFGRRHPILDGNVARVLSRLFRIEGDPRRRATQGALWKKAEEILPDRSVSHFNQALMELGALVCTPRNPRCLVCPIGTGCAARRAGLQDSLPAKPIRPSPVRVRMAAAVVEDQGRVLLYKRQAEELMRDLWELPGGLCRPGEEPRVTVVREARERYGIALEVTEEIVPVRHSIMNRRITVHGFEARLRGGIARATSTRTWVEPEAAARLAVSSMTLKVLRAWRGSARPPS